MLPSFGVIAASAIGVAIDLTANSGWPRRRWISFALVGLVMVAAGTAIGLGRSLLRLPATLAVEAARQWLELGMVLAFLALLIYCFSIGSRRPLLLGLIGITVGLAVAVIDYASPDVAAVLRGRWLVFGTDQARATGPFSQPEPARDRRRDHCRPGGDAGVGGQQGLPMPWVALGLLALIALVPRLHRGALFGLVLAGGAVLALRSRRVALAYGIAVGALAILAVPILVGARLAVLRRDARRPAS